MPCSDCFLSESQFMQQMLIPSVTLHHVRAWRQDTGRQRPIKHCQCVTLNISCLDTFNFLVIKSLLSDHCIFPLANGPLVLPPRRPPPPPGPRRRHLHRRGRTLPLYEGDQTIWALVSVALFLFSQVGPLFGVPVDLFSPVENKVTLGPSPYLSQVSFNSSVGKCCLIDNLAFIPIICKTSSWLQSSRQ